MEAAVGDFAGAQIQPCSAVLLQWEPLIPHSPFHCRTEAAWHGHNHAQVASVPGPSSKLSRETPHPMQRVCARTIFPGVNAMKVCLGKSSAWGNQVLEHLLGVLGYTDSFGALLHYSLA